LLTPSQTVKYLGVLFHLDSLTLSLPHSKILQISTLCLETLRHTHRSRRQLESLLGLLNFAASIIPLGRLRLLPLITWMNSKTSPGTRDIPVQLDHSFLDPLQIWQDTEFLSCHVPMTVPTPSLQLMTDASRGGWCGVLLPHKVWGLWPPEFGVHSSNWLELEAIYLSLVEFLQLLKGQDVLIMTDNTTAVSCLRHQGSLRSGPLMSLTITILEFCLLHSITLVPKHLPGGLNVLADRGSRSDPITTEWSLDKETFGWLSSLAGPFQV
ncbi:unnamed protein product, partial [Meganyctiphanes norvegica]